MTTYDILKRDAEALERENKTLRDERADVMTILRSELDRAYDEKDTLRTLAIVAVNALHRARQKPNVAGEAPGGKNL